MEYNFKILRINAEFFDKSIAVTGNFWIKHSKCSAVNVSCNVTKPVNVMLQHEFMLLHECFLCVYCWKVIDHFNFTVILSTARCSCKMYQTKHWTCQTAEVEVCQQLCWGQWESEVVSSLSCLACDAVPLMFQRTIVLVSSGSDHLRWLAPEDEGATVVQNIRKYLLSIAVSRPRWH